MISSYYTQDYLGNNRAVINGSTGAVSRMAFGKHCKARIKKGAQSHDWAPFLNTASDLWSKTVFS